MEELKKFAVQALKGEMLWTLLPEEWQEDIDVAEAAMGHKNVLRGVPLVRWVDLPEVCRTGRNVVVAALNHNHFYAWNNVPAHLETDPDVAFAAWSKGLVDAKEIPCVDSNYFRKALETARIKDWDKLPENLKNDIAFARSIQNFKICARSVLNQFPVLQHERDIWSTIIDTVDTCTVSLTDIVTAYAPQFISSNRELMLRACKKDPCILSCVHESLGMDRSFLEVALEMQPNALRYMKHGAQRLFRDLVLQTLSILVSHPDSYSEHEANYWAAAIVPEFWEDRNFVEDWFRLGLPFAETVFPAQWRNDRQICLLIATHGSWEHRAESFATAAPSIRGDTEFMRQVLELDPSLFACGTPALQQDFELAVFAFASSSEVVERYLGKINYEGQSEFISRLRTTIEEKLSVRDAVFKTILCGMSQTSSIGCTLPLLSQGEETTLRIIAAYLAVPIGVADLQRLRRAAANLAQCDESLGSGTEPP